MKEFSHMPTFPIPSTHIQKNKMIIALSLVESQEYVSFNTPTFLI